jgi:hypothetical protein
MKKNWEVCDKLCDYQVEHIFLQSLLFHCFQFQHGRVERPITKHRLAIKRLPMLEQNNSYGHSPFSLSPNTWLKIILF